MKKNKNNKDRNNLSNFIFYSLSVVIAVTFFISIFHFQNECTRLESTNNNIDGSQKVYLEELKFELKNLDLIKKELIKQKLDEYKKQNQIISIIEPKTIYWGDINLKE